jgi:hypothetical protein
MPIIIFALVVAGLFLVYYFLLNNVSNYTTEKPPEKGPFDVIYLPEDLEAEKQRRRQREEKQREAVAKDKEKETEDEDESKR